MKFTVRRISSGRKKVAKKSTVKKTKLGKKQITLLKKTGLVAMTVILTVLVYFGEQTGSWFKASVLDAPQPFNGTVLPISKVPDWVHWGGDHSTRYEQVATEHLNDLPRYELSIMQFPDEQLEWGNPEHDVIRNMKITYSAVYLGNYKFDHREGVGSHLGIDIKLPLGTPIHAIANGKVIKAQMKNTGFGNHIVIQHPNVPDPKNPGHLTTLYSAYNHMERLEVVEGQNVIKGQAIGLSGNSGTSTGPHLHLQIDTDSAPWHPYWPFSWEESQAAGLSFFEAVNAGLGINNARSHTINPITFAINHIGQFTLVSADTTETIKPTPEPTPEPIVEESIEPEHDTVPAVEVIKTATVAVAGDAGIEIIENPFEEIEETVVEPEPDVASPDLFSYHVFGDTSSLINNGVTVVFRDESRQIETLADDTEIRVHHSGVGRVLKKKFTRSDFNAGEILVSVVSDQPGIADVTVGKSSHRVEFIEKVKPMVGFKIEHDGRFVKNILETVTIKAVDETGAETKQVVFNGVANITVVSGSAKIIPEQVSVDAFENGKATIRVAANTEDPIRLRVQNGALVGESEFMRPEESKAFTDINRTHDNYQAIKFLKERGVISGYSDGSFQPNRVVNRAEALKMLLTAFNYEVVASNTITFSDVEPGAWFAPSVEAAAYHNIVSGYGDGTFRPASGVNRAEYLKMLLNTAEVEAADASTKPYDDVSTKDWFAPYAFLANKMNLLVPAPFFNPAGPVTRAGVAETIYRMVMIRENNLVTYSE